MRSQAGIYIGTSGWSYPKGEGTWKGYFYPAGKINELEYYSQFFDTVEINSSFYRPPAPAYAEKWAKTTPAGFLFSVKLWQKFTHPKMYKEAYGEEAVISQRDVDEFNRSLEPLASRGKLGALLAQFPPSFKNDGYGQQILGAVAKAFGQYPLAVELRHRSWSDDAGTARFLRENSMAWVQIDEPKFPSSVAADTPITGDNAYFRFHGRNAKDWWTGDSETRYRYLYSPDEIAGLAEKVKAAGEKVKLLFAFFNNHWQAYAPRNASDLKRALKLPFQQIPMNLEMAPDKQDTESKEGVG
jgi:uncharacterized protein YecE (DUF72 family)